MNRSMGWRGALFAFVLVLAACGSSGSSKSSTTETIGKNVSNVETPTTVPKGFAPSACSLVTDAQVTSLLGAAATGVETDTQPSYKTCTWKVGGTGPDAGNKIAVGLIRIANGQLGFGGTQPGLNAKVLTGVGDHATFSNGKSDSGLNEALFVADEGSVSAAITLFYGGPAASPGSLQSQLTGIMKSLFTAVGAKKTAAAAK